MYDLSFYIDGTLQFGYTVLKTAYCGILVTRDYKGAVPKKLHSFKLLFLNKLDVITHKLNLLITSQQRGRKRGSHWRLDEGHRTEPKKR